MRYITDESPGIRRRGHGAAAYYDDPRGRRIRDRDTISRIRSRAIPPAWSEVWVASKPEAHLQATGRDSRGRKQYRYHPRWREFRDSTKYTNIIQFAPRLPRIRRHVNRDLIRRGLPREKVLATVVRLLETSLIRVGNDEYARHNRSFGLTTLRDQHAQIRGRKVTFCFRGKSGVHHEVDLESPFLARIVRRCQELPGQELFQYQDDQGRVHDIGSSDVNDYLQAISDAPISAKDFRTWAGTYLAAQALQEFEGFDTHARAKRNVRRAVERVSARLGNTATVCRKCCVHPAVIDVYLDRTLLKTLQKLAEKELRTKLHSLTAAEAAVLALLQERMKRKLSKSTG